MKLPVVMAARHIGFTELCSDLTKINAPLPWWMEVHHKARETHRSVDMQMLLATGDDLDAAKERRGKCKPIST